MADFLGIGYEIWAVFGLIFLGVVYAISRPNKSIAVKTLWILRNRASFLFPAKADINGIYVDVKTARGKKAVSILQEGLPIEVREIPKNGKAYVIGGPDLDRKGHPKGLPNGIRDTDVGRVFYDVHEGRLRHMRLFATIEKSGTTLDFLHDQEKNGEANPHGSIVTQEIGATGAIYDKIQEAARDNWRTLILPLAAGFSGGIGFLFMVLVVLGRIKT